jgi:F-type H+-transporting ATPase subunit alpha
VSRVGGKAQTKAMKQVAGRLRLDLAQYRELVAFTQFGSELDKATQAQLARGERMIEILKQGQYEPLSMAKQVMIIYAGTNGHLDDVPVNLVRKFEANFYKYIERLHPDLELKIEAKQELTQDLAARLEIAVEEFRKEFKIRFKI